MKGPGCVPSVVSGGGVCKCAINCAQRLASVTGWVVVVAVDGDDEDDEGDSWDVASRGCEAQPTVNRAPVNSRMAVNRSSGLKEKGSVRIMSIFLELGLPKEAWKNKLLA